MVAVTGEYPKRESAGEFPGHGDKRSAAPCLAQPHKVVSGAISAKRNKQSVGGGRGKEYPKYERTGEFLERDSRALAYFPLTAGMRKSPTDKKSRAKDGVSFYSGRGRRKPSGGLGFPQGNKGGGCGGCNGGGRMPQGFPKRESAGES